MKQTKRLLLLALLIALRFAGHSQSLNDSTCLPNSQLKLALQKIEQLKQCEKELEASNRENYLLFQRIDIKDSIIVAMADKMQVVSNVTESYRRENTLLESDVAQLKVMYAALEKKYKADVGKQKRKKIFSQITTIGLAAFAGYLILK